MDKKIISKKLNEVFGESEIKFIAPTKFLSFVENVLVEQYEKLADSIDKKHIPNNEEVIKELRENKDSLEQIIKSIKEIKIPEAKDVVIPEYPKVMDITKPDWYKEFDDTKILELIKNSFKQKEFDKPLLSAPFYFNQDGVVIQGIPGKSFHVYATKLVTSQDMAVNWRDGLSRDIEGPQSLVSHGGFAESIEPPGCLFITTPGNDLNLIITGTKGGYAGGRVSYWIE
jgi:hypothetical protein